MKNSFRLAVFFCSVISFSTTYAMDFVKPEPVEYGALRIQFNLIKLNYQEEQKEPKNENKNESSTKDQLGSLLNNVSKRDAYLKGYLFDEYEKELQEHGVVKALQWATVKNDDFEKAKKELEECNKEIEDLAKLRYQIQTFYTNDFSLLKKYVVKDTLLQKKVKKLQEEHDKHLEVHCENLFGVDPSFDEYDYVKIRVRENLISLGGLYTNLVEELSKNIIVKDHSQKGMYEFKKNLWNGNFEQYYQLSVLSEPYGKELLRYIKIYRDLLISLQKPPHSIEI